MTPIHETIEEAFLSRWVGRPSVGEGTRQLMERHLNEILQQVLVENPTLHMFYPFPARVRVVQRELEGEYGWGFIGSGDEDLLEWVYSVQEDAMNAHFPAERWIQSTLPRVSRKDLIAAFARVVEAFRLPEDKDTLESLLRADVQEIIGDRELVSIALLLDSRPRLRGQAGDLYRIDEVNFGSEK